MENYEIIRQSLDLSESIGEGLEHISRQLDKGCYEEATPLFQDVIQAFMSIQMAVEPYLNTLPCNSLISLNRDIQNTLELIVTSYEKSSWNVLRETVQQKLLPFYREWKNELIGTLGSYISC